MSDGATPKVAEPEPRRGRGGLWLRLGLSAVLAAAIVAALSPYLQTVPADLEIAPSVLLAYLATLVPYHLLRAGRWVILLRPLAPSDEPLGIGVITRISLAGYMWIALLPFRLGEFARPLFAAQRTSITATRALGTIAIERVVDGLIVCGMFFVGVAGATTSEDLDALFIATVAVMAVFTAALGALIVAAARPKWVGRAAHVLIGWALPAPARWAAGVLVAMAEGLRALPSARSAAGFILASLAYWLTNAVGMWMLLGGCGIDITLQQTVAVLAVMNITLLIPGGPAQLGVFQTGVALGLALFVGSAEVHGPGSKFAFYLYVCQLGTIVVFGLVSQATLRLNWRALVMPRSR